MVGVIMASRVVDWCEKLLCRNGDLTIDKFVHHGELRSFLSERSQQVLLEGQTSNEAKVTLLLVYHRAVYWALSCS